MKHTAEIIIKAASEQKNIRVANLMSDLISPDPFSASIHSTEADYPSSNPIREGDHLSIASSPAQEVSALLSVGKLPEARRILQSWSISRLCSPLVFTCLLTGFVTGGFAAEAIGFYAWCRDHTLSPKEATALLNTVSVSLLVQAYQEKKQPDNALTVFEQARAARIPLTVDVFEAVVGLLDGNHLWRAKYRELIRRAEYADRGKWRWSVAVRRRREALQAALVLEQLRRAVEVARGCAELSARMERCVHRRRDGRGVVIEGSRLSPALLRVSVLDLLLSQSQSSSLPSSSLQSPSQAKPPQRGTVCVKVGRSAEKEQALEKLLLSDLQPPIHFRKEEKATVFVGGVKKVSVVSYVLDHGDVSAWREARKDSVLSPVWNKHASPSNPSRKTQILEPHRLNVHGLLHNGLLIFRRSRRHHVGDIEAEIRGKNVGNVLYASAPPRTSTPHVVHPNEVLLLVAAIIDEVRVVERVVHRPREHAVSTPHTPARRLTAP